MSELEQRTTMPLEPIYQHQRPDAPLHISTESVELVCEGQAFGAGAEIRLDFVPRATVVFETTVDSKAWLMMFMSPKDGAKLRFPERSISVPVLQTSNGRLVPKSSVVTAMRPTPDIRRTICHIFNFPDFHSSTDCVVTTDLGAAGERSSRIGRVMLRGGGWTVTIAALDGSQSRRDDFESGGDWLLTHVAEVIRDDGSAYSSESLDDLLHCLHHFLSFAMGRWVGLAMPVGFDAQGKRVFEQWGMPLAAEGVWKGSVSWFDAHHGESLSQAFFGFYALWNDKQWKRPLGNRYIGISARQSAVLESAWTPP